MSEMIIPWGALPYYQIHFIVLGNSELFTRKRTEGIIHKKIVNVWWEGGVIADQLNRDTDLKLLLKEVLIKENDIFIEPIDNCTRIHSGWKAEHKMEMDKNTLQVFDIVAGHIKKFISELRISQT